MGTPIKPDTISIGGLFPSNHLYKVPRYQRDYSWIHDDHVQDLFGDFRDAFDNYNDSNYFLGQIIVCKSDESVPETGRTQVFDIIDGQQRLTTIFLYLWVGLQVLEDNWEEPLGNSPKRWQFNQLKNSLVSPNLLDSSQVFPAILPPRPGIPFVKAMVNDSMNTYERSDAPTEQRLIKAQEKLEELFFEFADEFGWDSVWELLSWVAENVYLFRLETDSQDEALRHFIRLNDRGLSLEQVDIVKSLIFENVPDEAKYDHDKIDEIWNSAATTLSKARLKRLRSMSALLKFLIGAKTGAFIASTGGDFAERWGKILEKREELDSLLQNLVPKAQAVVDLSKGEGIFPKKYDPDLTIGTRERSATQQIEILLAADQLQKSVFETLLSALEDRILLSTWGPEAARDIEPRIHEWAKHISEINVASTSSEQILDFARTWYPDGNFVKFAKEALDVAFIDWTYTKQAQHGRIRYFLARVNRLVDSSFDATAVDKKLATYMEKATSKSLGFHLDHIFPKDAKFDLQWEQSDALDLTYGTGSRKHERINSIGNLALLYRADNLEASNELPSSEKKMKIYAGQPHYLQRALAGEPWRGSNWGANKYTQMIDFLGVRLDDWNEVAVVRMAENYKKLMIHDMAQNLGLESEMIDWLRPLPK